MIRRVNFTERVKVARKDCHIALLQKEQGSAQRFRVALDLSEYSFPANAQVRLEAWRSGSVQRWELGSIGTLSTEFSRRLTEVPESSQFRLLVVAGDGSGRLLGSALRIRPTLPTRSLIPVRETSELDGEVWRVDCGAEGDLPELLLNDRVPEISTIVRSDATFRALVMPQVLRTVFTQMLIVQQADPTDEESSWEGWLRLARTLLPDREPPHVDRTEGSDGAQVAQNWIDELVSAFAANSVRAETTYRAALDGAES